MIIPAGTLYEVFFREDGRPIRGNPVTVINFWKYNLTLNAIDSDLNERIFRLHDFTIKPAVKVLKSKPKK